jgi:hypothetical protein
MHLDELLQLHPHLHALQVDARSLEQVRAHCAQLVFTAPPPLPRAMVFLAALLIDIVLSILIRRFEQHLLQFLMGSRARTLSSLTLPIRFNHSEIVQQDFIAQAGVFPLFVQQVHSLLPEERHVQIVLRDFIALQAPRAPRNSGALLQPIEQHSQI